MSEVALFAQAQSNMHWYEEQIVGVLAGALIPAAVLLTAAMANVRHQRAIRWDESRRLVYSRFVAAVTDFNASGHAEALARWAWIRAPADRREVASAEHTTKVDDFNSASRRLYDVHAELRLLATVPVAQAARAVIDETIERHKVVDAVFEDILRTPSSELSKASEIWQARVDAFIDAASHELGIKKR